MMPLILQNEDSGTDIQKGVMIASSKCENKNEDRKRCNEYIMSLLSIEWQI
jgi:hypothetical protein